MSAVTIPDMARIVADHGLVAVPVDLDPATMAPRLDFSDELVTPWTVAVVVAHLFGGRLDLAPLVERCRRDGLLLIEDCAQSYRGPGDAGTAGADASIFSFGPIKTATAFGGGLARVGDAALRARMRELHATWPLQRRRAYAARVARCGALVALQHPVAYGLAAAVGDGLGRPLDQAAGQAARSCPDRRRRPSVRAGPAPRPGGGAGGTVLPGPAPAAVGAAAGRAAPAGRPEAAVVGETLAHLVCLPAYPELPEPAFLRMLDVVRHAHARDRADWRTRA